MNKAPIDHMQLFLGKQAMECIVKSGGRIRLTRIATPKYIADLLDLKLPNGKRPKTAQACLDLIVPMLERADKDRLKMEYNSTVGMVGVTALPPTPGDN